MKRFRYLAVASVVAAAALLGGTSLPAHADTTVNTVTFSQIVFQQTSGYCATIVDHTYPAGSGKAKPGDPVVLGNCAGAVSQEFYIYQNGLVRELASAMHDGANGNGMCITLSVYAGEADGGPVVAGDCALAATQDFYAYPGYYGHELWEIGLRDSTGHNFAMNDKNDVYAVGNPLNASFASSGQPSEDWYGPAPCLNTPQCQ